MSEILGANSILEHNQSYAHEAFIPFQEKYRCVKAKCDGIILMAGGNGKRLAPLTNYCPKPLLKVGSRPLLETTIKRLIEDGFANIWISVNYLGGMIEEYFGNGNQLGAEIKYLREESALGTAGSLSLLDTKPKKPLIVMNADILTDIDFELLLDKHKQSKAIATVGIIEQSVQIPYGVVNHQNGNLRSLNEKPKHKFFINAGIYVIQPEVLNLINGNSYVDMTDIINILKQLNKKLSVYEIKNYWCDIGHKVDLEKANKDFNEYFI